MQLRQSGLTWHVAGDEVVILDLDGSVYLKLNGSAKLLWERLAESASKDDLTVALVETYGIDEERADADVEAFLADAQSRGLLEPTA